MTQPSWCALALAVKTGEIKVGRTLIVTNPAEAIKDLVVQRITLGGAHDAAFH
jgi:hypothetical protein